MRSELRELFAWLRVAALFQAEEVGEKSRTASVASSCLELSPAAHSAISSVTCS